MPKWWLVVGSPRNWRFAFSHGDLWGLKETQRNLWEHLERGDRALFYASSPVKGVIGVGLVQGKFIQDVPLWPDEVKLGKALWPFRIELRVQYCLPEDRWEQEKALTPSLQSRVRRRQMLQLVEEALAIDILDTFPGSVKEGLIPPPQEPEPIDLHDQIAKKIVEIGRLQDFIAEREYDMDGSKLDVVWRRVERAVPNYVFEVHIGGDLHRDLAKLKHAFDIWNSNIFLVSPSGDRDRVDKLLSGLFHEIRTRLRFVEVGKIVELFDKKHSVRNLEEELGIL